MEKYLFSREAVNSILDECFRSGDNLETGGILIAPKQHRRIVTDIIPSSVYAERQAYTYYQSDEDVRILNQKLREFQSIGYTFSGYWHRHPSGMSMLSSGDINTCADILQSPNYKINNKLMMCIATERERKLSVFAYNASLNKENEVVVKPLSIKVLPKDSIQEILEFIDITEGVRNEEDFRSRQNHRRTETRRYERQGTVTAVRVSSGKIRVCQLPGNETGIKKSRRVQLEPRRFCSNQKRVESFNQ